MTAQRIFLVEDNAADIELVREVFRSLETPCEIQHYETVQEAVEAANRAGLDGRELPGLILVDYNLPGGSGLDVLAAIAANPHLNEVPKAILSSFVLPEEATEAALLGAYCVISKPVRLNEFLRDVGMGISRLLERKASTSRKEASAGADGLTLSGGS